MYLFHSSIFLNKFIALNGLVDIQLDFSQLDCSLYCDHFCFVCMCMCMCVVCVQNKTIHFSSNSTFIFFLLLMLRTFYVRHTCNLYFSICCMLLFNYGWTTRNERETCFYFIKTVFISPMPFAFCLFLAKSSIFRFDYHFYSESEFARVWNYNTNELFLLMSIFFSVFLHSMYYSVFYSILRTLFQNIFIILS